VPRLSFIRLLFGTSRFTLFYKVPRECLPHVQPLACPLGSALPFGLRLASNERCHLKFPPRRSFVSLRPDGASLTHLVEHIVKRLYSKSLSMSLLLGSFFHVTFESVRLLKTLYLAFLIQLRSSFSAQVGYFLPGIISALSRIFRARTISSPWSSLPPFVRVFRRPFLKAPSVTDFRVPG